MSSDENHRVFIYSAIGVDIDDAVPIHSPNNVGAVN